MNSRRNHVYTATLFDSKTLKAEAAVTWCKNKKIAILALTPTLNLTQTLTLTLILTQTQNLTQTLNVNLKNKKSTRANKCLLFPLLFSLGELLNVTLATSNF